MSMVKWFVLVYLGAILLSGCVHEPVRHLASDASLISPGASTKTDVLTYLGDPDERQETETGAERWLYYEEQLSAMQRTFYVGRWFDPKSVSRIIVTFDGEMVTAGSILIRQRGTKFKAGNNVGLGRDYTIFSTIDGYVKFEVVRDRRKQVSVYPERVTA